MAERGGGERGGERGGFGRGFGRGDRGGRRGPCQEEEKWVPCTKLGRLVKEGRFTKMEEIYLHSLPVKEHQIVETLCPGLKDEVMKITPVQKQTRAGQRTRFKAFVVVGDSNGHVGLDVKCAKEVATSIRGAIILAKLSIVPVRRGYWGNKMPEHREIKRTGLTDLSGGVFFYQEVASPGALAGRRPVKALSRRFASPSSNKENVPPA